MQKLTTRYPGIAPIAVSITAAETAMIECYERGGKLLLCGNGGSAADCDHMVGELMKGFQKRRQLSEEQKQCLQRNCPLLEEALLAKLQRGLPAISLPSLAVLNSAVSNDNDPEYIYAQALFALGNQQDILIAISTSGNAKNVFAAAKVAKGMGMTVIALTGAGGGVLKTISDICICVGETETYKIQELHLPIYHYLCSKVESHFFD